MKKWYSDELENDLNGLNHGLAGNPEEGFVRSENTEEKDTATIDSRDVPEVEKNCGPITKQRRLLNTRVSHIE